MNNKHLSAIAIALLLLLTLPASAAGPWPTDYTGIRAKAVNFAGRLVCLVNAISAYVILIFIVIGGVKYIMADDPSEAMQARQMISNALVGGLLMLMFVALAEAFGVPEYC